MPRPSKLLLTGLSLVNHLHTLGNHAHIPLILRRQDDRCEIRIQRLQYDLRVLPLRIGIGVLLAALDLEGVPAAGLGVVNARMPDGQALPVA